MAEEVKPGLEDKAVEILDKLQEGAGAVTAKLQQLAEAHGEAAIELGLSVVRIMSAAELFTGVTLAVIGWGLWRFAGQKMVEKAKASRHGCDAEGWKVCAVAVGASATACGIGAAVHLMDLWSWVGVFYPEAVIAKRLLGL